MRLATVGIVVLGLAGLGGLGAGAYLLLTDPTPATAPGLEAAAAEPGPKAPGVEAEAAISADALGVVGTGGIDPEWLADTAEATGIPERALSAYASAALAVAEESPDCGIGWNTVAAIGSVESAHGAINGAVLGDDGVTRPRITGPVLDGTEYDAVRDTDGGELDGDTQWDRAVGPMQFLPSTWQTYGRDADGDGEADPQQIDDAALGTAVMLCAVGGDLTQPENWIAAVDAYNPNLAYNNDVAETADRYALAVG